MTIQEKLGAMKQREAAKRLGISRPYVAQLIKGVRKPSVFTIIKVGDALECDDAEIVASVRAWAATPSKPASDAKVA